MGDDTFELSNISRAELDPTLFSVPADFQMINNPKFILR